MKKRITALIYFLVIQQTIFAQIVLPSYPDSIFSTYYLQRVSHFETLLQTKDDIIFAGNNHTQPLLDVRVDGLVLSNHQQLLGSYELNKSILHNLKYFGNYKMLSVSQHIILNLLPPQY